MRSLRRGSVAVAAGVALLVTGGTARAEERPAARLVYLLGKGTETCPSEASLREAVQLRLGYDPFSSYAASTMFAEMTADEDGGFSASLKLVDPDSKVLGDRTLRVKGRCSELIDAMALTMSIAIDPMSATRDGPVPGLPPSEKRVSTETAPPEPAPVTPQPEPPAGDEPPRAAPPPAARRERLQLSVSAGPLVSMGTAPGLALGGGLDVRAQLGRWLLGIGGRGDLPASAPAEGLGRVESSLVAGTIMAGAREGWIFAGAVGSLGRLSAVGADVAESRRRDALFLAAGFRIGLALPLSDRVEARGHVEVLANLLRHTLSISNTQAYEYPVGSANLAGAIAVRFL